MMMRNRLLSVAKELPKVFRINLTNMLFGAVLFSGFVLSARWTFYTVAPRSIFYTYYQVHSTGFTVGEPMIFFSEREVKSSHPIEFLDILYCDTNDNGDFKRQFAWRSESFRPNRVERATGDTLAQKIKDKEGFTFGDTSAPYIPMVAYDHCYLDTKVTMVLPLGVTKVQNLTSSLFAIEDNN